jgi:tRNA G18 (ribose-2'-O)-methylase SpoU
LIELIDLDDDPRLESYRRVGDAAWLESRGLFVAEGRLVVERLFETGRYVVESVLLTPAARTALEARLPSNALVYVADQTIVNRITGFNFHRGCLALVRRPLLEVPLTAFEHDTRVVLLEGVGNADNVGGLFRSAAALGAGGVILDSSSGDPFYRKSVRTSMGAVLRLPFSRVDRWPDGFAALRAMEFAIVALTPGGSLTLDEYAMRPAGRVALLAGAEGPGLSAASTVAADVTVRIPVDPLSDSLNVVVAVSIALARLNAGV